MINKYILLFFLALPGIGFSQQKTKEKVTGNKIKIKSVKPSPVDGFVIKGEVIGFKDSTPVAFLNQQTQVPETQTVIKNGRFEIKGKMPQPGFKLLILNNAQPIIPIFLDNSIVTIKGTRDAAESFKITGSPSHDQFVELTTSLKPYDKVFAGENYDSVAISDIAKIIEAFIKKYPSSYVSPLAIVRYYQATQDPFKTEGLYNLLPASVKSSDISVYAYQIIKDGKVNAIGSVIPDFSQADSTGKQINISSFRGKYVLIDFWASWCHPCRMENPNVLATYNRFKNRNFTILGVSLDKAKEAWTDAIRMDSLSWTHVSDLQGWGNTVAQQFKITSIPQNILVDPNGKIIAKNLRGEMLQKRLEGIFK